MESRNKYIPASHDYIKPACFRKGKKPIACIILLLLGAGFFHSCDSRLDIAPINILTEEQIFQSESAIDAYMVSLYDRMQMEDLTFRTGAGNYLAHNTDEVMHHFTDEKSSIIDGTGTQWWGYDNVRNVNDLMEKLPNSILGETKRKQVLGEAKYIRAYYYFSMVKRYGGIPIIKNVQNFTGDNLEELQVSRDKHEDVYDFIANDLDSAALLLGETNSKGRVNKYAALALKSRVMLYAASEAKYASVQLDGIIGIPSASAGKYWQAAYDAAEAVIASGKYELYNKNPTDKAANFQMLFLDENNPEAIFSKYYSYPDKGHFYDMLVLPFGVRGPEGYGSNMGPTLECVEQFEYIDGTPGTLRITDSAGNPIYYANPVDLFKDKDPRCVASIIVPFSEWQETVIDVQAGIYDLGQKYEAGDYSALYNVETHQPDNINGTLHIVGLNGFGGNEKTQTGFYVRKYLDVNQPRSRATQNGSDQAWIDLRYGEVLLNYAEAAFESGRTEEAKWAVNAIRERAGIRLLEDQEVTLERIRHERIVELAFENHRWWDYRRWRISDDILSNTRFHALKPYYDVQAEAYRFETGIAGRFPKTFPVRAYYERIDPGEITRNPNIIQNPNY
ncbi:RagB/SusD family nutrient uptake outer membrane protein [Proteiniphilum acetatigenes]|uniref:RagB/SusD family nutrient uptake outer membrane protein n=1 Tax=Proteiniphilum acetatigenes TaxID=294710 RepID=UPI00146A045E|nr:RagB/SusD family nutrient uptake outer membrane protein [Proteiniphilum acetatigenes]